MIGNEDVIPRVGQASRTLCWWVWKQALEALETVETLPRPYLPGSCTLVVDHACAIGDHVCIQREPDVSDGTRPEISPNPSNVASESHSSTASTSSVALTPSYCAAAHGFPSDRPQCQNEKERRWCATCGLIQPKWRSIQGPATLTTGHLDRGTKRQPLCIEFWREG